MEKPENTELNRKLQMLRREYCLGPKIQKLRVN